MTDTDKTGKITKTTATKVDTLVGLVRRMEPQIKAGLPSHISPERMSRIVVTALNTNPKLQQCTPASFLACIMQCVQLGLEPNTPLGHAHLIPFKNQCSLIIGYQGMIDLAMRSGDVSSVYAYVAREGDEFEYKLGLYPDVRHVPSDDADRETKPITHVYAVAKMRDGDPIFTVASIQQVEKRRKRSMAARNPGSPWDTDYEAMVLKTAVRMLFKWIPKSSERLGRALAIDTGADLGNDIIIDADPHIVGVLEEEGLVEENNE